MFARLDRIPGRELIRGGTVSGHTSGAVYLMDLSDIGRALSAEPDGVASARAVRWYAGAGGRLWCFAACDTAAFLRTRDLWVRPMLVLLLGVALLVTGTAQPPLVQLGLIVVTVFAAVPSFGPSFGPLARRTAITLALVCCCRCRCPLFG